MFASPADYVREPLQVVYGVEATPVDPARDILFLRQFATALLPGRGSVQLARSVMGHAGATIAYRGHYITFFFPGLGRFTRQLPDHVISRIRSGQITDIVDIGAGGGLDPTLRVGDVVLSDGDASVDGEAPLTTRRRAEASSIFRSLAEANHRGFFTGRILTTRKVIRSRDDRLALHAATGCRVVQMEHFWMLRHIARMVGPEAFARLHVTHAELISDAVPPRNISVAARCLSELRALDFCVIRNQRHVGRFKADFLRLWLEERQSPQ
jgi:purine-nucleoside phosphorylase